MLIKKNKGRCHECTLNRKNKKVGDGRAFVWRAKGVFIVGGTL